MDVPLATSVLSFWDSKDVFWHEKRRVLIIKNKTIEFTPTEQRFFSSLYSGEPVTYADLAESAYACPLDLQVRTMMDKHIDRIRGKLRGSGLYIYCILGYGYVLLPELDE